MKFKNIRLVKTILYTISKIMDENCSDQDKEIIKKTIPQFKRDLASLWNSFDLESQKKIADVLPQSWKWDMHVILTEESPTDLVA